jgi:hypothetical protein
MQTRVDTQYGGLRQIGLSVPTHLLTLAAPQKRLLELPPADADGGIIYHIRYSVRPTCRTEIRATSSAAGRSKTGF